MIAACFRCTLNTRKGPCGPPACRCRHRWRRRLRRRLLTPSPTTQPLQAALARPDLWQEAALLERLLYKNANQHRGAQHFQRLQEVRWCCLQGALVVATPAPACPVIPLRFADAIIIPLYVHGRSGACWACYARRRCTAASPPCTRCSTRPSSAARCPPAACCLLTGAREGRAWHAGASKVLLAACSAACARLQAPTTTPALPHTPSVQRRQAAGAQPRRGGRRAARAAGGLPAGGGAGAGGAPRVCPAAGSAGTLLLHAAVPHRAGGACAHPGKAAERVAVGWECWSASVKCRPACQLLFLLSGPSNLCATPCPCPAGAGRAADAGCGAGVQHAR